MSTQFNIDEVFEMAEQIERNGEIFYRRAEALMPKNSQTGQLMATLADMEVKHYRIFVNMRVEMLDLEGMESILNPDFDPEGLASTYLQAMANGHVFDLTKSTNEYFTGKETPEAILKMAIEREKDSIIYYIGMKEVVREDFGKDRIDSIIREEMSHIVYINNEIDRQPNSRK
jgi:rubrerythrin